MKVRLIALFFAIGLTVPLAAAGKYALGAQHAIVIPSDTGEVEVATSRGFAATAEWFFTDRVTAHFSTTFVNPETILFPANPPPDDVDLGTLGLDIYALTGRYYFSPDARWSPYAGAGGAYVVIGNLEDRFGDDLEIVFDPEVAPVVEGGLRFRFRPSLSFNAGATYIPVTATSNIRFNDDPRITLPEELALNPVTVSVGVAWRF